MAGDQFWFPAMSAVEIVDAFSGWGYSISNEQVARPSSDFVVKIYSACLEQVTGITAEVLQTPLDGALAILDNADSFPQALSHNMLLYHLQRLARAAKINDFSAKDLYFPDPERTRKNFSAFINFIKFSEQCGAFIIRLQEKSAAVVQDRERVIQLLGEMYQKIELIKSKRAKDEPACDALRKENDSIKAELVAYKELQITLHQDLQVLKDDGKALVKRKENLNNETANVMDGINRTRSRVVQSPERIKRNIITMGATAAEDRRTVAMHEAKTRDLQAKISALLNIEKDVRSCVEQLQVIDKEIQNYEKSHKELTDTKDQLDQRKGEKTELLMRRERVLKQFSNAQEKLERAQKHAEDKRIANQQTLERVQREYEDMVIERQDNDKQVEELRAEALEVERKSAEHLKTSQAELNELLAEYWRLRHATEVYMETLANKLGMQVTST